MFLGLFEPKQFCIFHFKIMFVDSSTKPIGCQFARRFCEIKNEIVFEDKSVVFWDGLFWSEIPIMLQYAPFV